MMISVSVKPRRESGSSTREDQRHKEYAEQALNTPESNRSIGAMSRATTTDRDRCALNGMRCSDCRLHRCAEIMMAVEVDKTCILRTISTVDRRVDLRHPANRSTGNAGIHGVCQSRHRETASSKLHDKKPRDSIFGL